MEEICFYAFAYLLYIVCIKRNVYLRLCKDSDVDIILEYKAMSTKSIIIYRMLL